MSSQEGHRLCIAVAQPLVLPGNVAENLARMTPMVAEAAERGADLVLFSECHLTGYDLKNIGVRSAISADDRAIRAVCEMSVNLNVAIAVGFYERDVGSIYNSVAICLPDGRKIIERKYSLSPHEVANTPVQPGKRQRELVSYRGHRIATLICSDHGTEGIYGELAVQGCTLVLGPTAGCGDAARGLHQADLRDPDRLNAYLKVAESGCFVSPLLAIEHRFAMAWSNQSGYDPSIGYFHPGHSAIIDHTGEITSLTPARYIFEHLRPQLGVGFVTRPTCAKTSADPVARVRGASATSMAP